MLINKKNIRKLEKLVEKKLKKAYKSSSYFYVDNVIVQFQDFEGINAINCVAGHEIVEKNGKKQIPVYSDKGKAFSDWTAYTDVDLGLFYANAPGSTAKVISADFSATVQKKLLKE